MPDTPPCSDKGHPTMSVEEIKDNDKAEPGILNPCFNSDGTYISSGISEAFTEKITGGKSKGIMHQYDIDYVIIIFEKQVKIIVKYHCNNHQQYHKTYIADWFCDLYSHYRKSPGKKYSQS